MKIISSNIDNDKISLVTDSPLTRLTLSYNNKLKSKISLAVIASALEEFTITKEALGLDGLNNIYFKLHLIGVDLEDSTEEGLFIIDVENNKTKSDYDALDFKQELDNLNYYDGIVKSLTDKKHFLEANDFFFNYITFLEKKLNGNNITQAVKRQRVPNTDDS